MKLTLEVDQELADKIVLMNLKESYSSVCSEIDRYKDINNPQVFQKQDYKAAKKAEKFLRRTINYFSLQEDKIKKFH